MIRQNHCNSSQAIKIIRLLGIVFTAAALAVAALNGCLVVKLFRSLDNAQRTMKKVEKAADRYLADDAKEKE